MSNKKLPPYAQQIVDRLKVNSNSSNEIFLFLGQRAWEKTKAHIKFRLATMLPDGCSSSDYRWSFVAGKEMLIFCLNPVRYQMLRRLGFELLVADSSIVRVVGSDYKILTIFRQGDKK